MADVYNSGGKRTDSYNGKLDFNQSEGRILGRDQNSVPRLEILADGNTFRMKVSQENENVLTTDEQNIIFNSDNNLFKIVHSDFIDINKAANDIDAGDAYIHGLGYAPLVLAYVVPFVGSSSTILQVPYYRMVTSGTDVGKSDLFFYVDVNATNINFNVFTLNFGPANLYTATFTSRFYYYILQETAGSL